MNIKVITRHAPVNYGSVLQALALQTAIESLGHRCEIIDYLRSNEHGFKGIISSLKCNQSWNSSPLKRIAYILTRYPSEKLSETYFRRTREKYLHLTNRCSSVSDLKKLDADLFMTGSDQVWSTFADKNYDPAYFLSFVGDDKKKVAYAASFGKATLPWETLNDYKKLLSRYKYISVRENSAVEMLKQIGIHCDGTVLDPALLLDARQWENFINEKTEVKDCVLAYQIHSDQSFDRYAQQIANKMNLPLYRISPNLHQISRSGRLVYLPNISKFLSHFQKAKMIVTDSFHGTVFSIIFNTPFIEYITDEQSSCRNRDLLQLTELQSRLAASENDFEPLNRLMNFTAANAIISAQREKSIKLLQQFIND